MDKSREFFAGVSLGLLIACSFGIMFITDNIKRQIHPETARVNPDNKTDKLDLIQNKISDAQHIDTVRTSSSSLDDISIANDLKEKVRVLIWVMTAPKNLNTKARYVKETWAKRADKVLFFSSQTNASFPTIGLNVSEGRDHLIAKTMQAYQHIYKHHRYDFDWFMKADDDTYILVENLRYFLSDKNTSQPIFYGKLFKSRAVKQGYYSGGSGYVLSREALERLGTKGMDPAVCKQDGWTEDVDMSRCMEKLNVKTTNANDALGRSRFHPFTPENHLHGHLPHWWPEWDVNKGRIGQDSISNYPISFHYVKGKEMQTLDFYFYHARLYGVRHVPLHLNP